MSNTHLYWHPRGSFVRLNQAAFLLRRLMTFSKVFVLASSCSLSVRWPVSRRDSSRLSTAMRAAACAAACCFVSLHLRCGSIFSISAQCRAFWIPTDANRFVPCATQEFGFPVAMCGDFNTTPDGHNYHFLTKSRSISIGAALACGLFGGASILGMSCIAALPDCSLRFG